MRLNRLETIADESATIHNMPRQQVYGKRSRAIYDPFAAFASPQRQSPKDVGELQVVEVAEELSRLSVRNGSQKHQSRNKRSALGEINANAAVRPVLLAQEKTQSRQRVRSKIVVEDDEESEEDNKLKSRAAHLAPTSQEQKASEKHFEPEEGAAYNEIDEVPLFCDDHGYDTEEDTQQCANIFESQNNHRSNGHRELSQGLFVDTSSITALRPTPPTADKYSEHCARLLELSSHGVTHFPEWANQLSNHFTIAKIAEASFGEVYRLSLLEQLSGFSSKDESVFKIIALRPPESALPKEKRKRDAVLKKAESMSTPDDVANEVKLLQRMSSIPGFTNFRDVRVIRGRPLSMFVKAFKEFNAAQKSRKKELSHFLDPAKKASYA